MTRIRIIIPAAKIEWTKLYLTRGAALLLCVFIFPLAAHASPFDSGISSIQTLFTGTIAKAASLIAIVIGGYTLAAVLHANVRARGGWGYTSRTVHS